MLGAPRSTVYHRRGPWRSLGCRLGPETDNSDDQLVEAIRRVLKDSPFAGEGYRKIRARLRREHEICVGGKRVLRMMRIHGLLAPQRPTNRKLFNEKQASPWVSGEDSQRDCRWPYPSRGQSQGHDPLASHIARLDCHRRLPQRLAVTDSILVSGPRDPSYWRHHPRRFSEVHQSRGETDSTGVTRTPRVNRITFLKMRCFGLNLVSPVWSARPLDHESSDRAGDQKWR